MSGMLESHRLGAITEVRRHDKIDSMVVRPRCAGPLYF